MRTYVRHALFWIMVYLLWTYMKSGGGFSSVYAIVNVLNIAIYMAIFYLLKHVQIPYLYNKGRYIEFTISLFVSSFLIYLLWRTVGVLWFDELRNLKYPNFLYLPGYLARTVQFYSPAMALLAWESHHERKKEQERMLILEKEKLSTELKFLKAQLNPHFLFNTLNNLYSYVVTNSPKAPDMILRLSGILDYVLYKSQKPSVPLNEEVETIEHFLELEKIRYGERLEVNFKTEGNLSIPVSPLILLSLVENAFKHGASGDIDSPKIDISINASEQTILCNVWNTKSQLKGELNDAYKEGIGLSNIKRQLNLIYPEQHELVINDQEREFNVSLSIKSQL